MAEEPKTQRRISIPAAIGIGAACAAIPSALFVGYLMGAKTKPAYTQPPGIAQPAARIAPIAEPLMGSKGVPGEANSPAPNPAPRQNQVPIEIKPAAPEEIASPDAMSSAMKNPQNLLDQGTMAKIAKAAVESGGDLHASIQKALGRQLTPEEETLVDSLGPAVEQSKAGNPNAINDLLKRHPGAMRP